MWIPKSEEEIVQAARSGSLEESAVFDAKKELPAKNPEIAKDIAAMANDGGVLVYGLDEDDQGRPTVLNPIPLPGQPERITAVVRTSIQEPPEVAITSIPTSDDPSIGYIVVAVPISERAPHMVVVKGENRFYGRTATGNTPLQEAEVARFYERRRRWEVDRDVLLGEEIGRSPYTPHEGYAYLHLFIRPVSASEDLLQRASLTEKKVVIQLNSITERVRAENVYPLDYSPDFRPLSNWELTTDGYTGHFDRPGSQDDPDAPNHTLTLHVDFDGTGHLFCGRAGAMLQGDKWLLLSLIAGNTTRFLHYFGQLYDRANYYGMADVGVALTGLKSGLPMLKYPKKDYRPYQRDDYRRTMRVSALSLREDSMAKAERLLQPLFNATSQGGLNPFPSHEVSPE